MHKVLQTSMKVVTLSERWDGERRRKIRMKGKERKALKKDKRTYARIERESCLFSSISTVQYAVLAKPRFTRCLINGSVYPGYVWNVYHIRFRVQGTEVDSDVCSTILLFTSTTGEIHGEQESSITPSASYRTTHGCTVGRHHCFT